MTQRDKDNNKIKVNHCLVSFSRSDDMSQFEKSFDEAIEELKSQL